MENKDSQCYGATDCVGENVLTRKSEVLCYIQKELALVYRLRDRLRALTSDPICKDGVI